MTISYYKVLRPVKLQNLMFKLINIVKTDNIIKIEPGETLSAALAKLTTSHDAAFIFSSDNKFFGVINPYYCFIKSSYPGNAKVEHCAFHPPHIKVNYPLAKVAELFMQSKIHYLPVFDQQEKFIGIISARHLLAQFQNLPFLKTKISDVLRFKNRSLITIYDDETIATAINAFKQTKISKLVVISKDLKLKGILSYYDLISYLASPKNSPQRGERVGNKINFYNLQVRNFAKNYVLTLTSDDTLSDVLNLILNKKIGSVVIVDKTRHPIGIVTTKDILRLFIKNKNDKTIEVTSKNLSKENRMKLGNVFNQLTLWIKKFPNLSKAKIFVKEEKDGGLFKVVLSLFPKKGHPQIIEREGKNLLKILKKVKKD